MKILYMYVRTYTYAQRIFTFHVSALGKKLHNRHPDKYEGQYDQNTKVVYISIQKGNNVN